MKKILMAKILAGIFNTPIGCALFAVDVLSGTSSRPVYMRLKMTAPIDSVLVQKVMVKAEVVNQRGPTVLFFPLSYIMQS